MDSQDVIMEGERDAQTTGEQIPEVMQFKNECENLWQELNNTQARLEARSRTFPVNNGDFDGSKVLEKVLRVKARKLQTELLALENKGLEVLSTSPEYLETLLQSQLTNSIEQLDETLQVVKGQREEVENEVRRQEEIINQHKEVKHTLQKKIETLQHEKENFHGLTSQVRDLERQKKAANKYLNQMMRNLGSFLSEYFPSPSAQDTKDKRQLKMHLAPSIRYVSLKQLIEDLMNISYSQPHDPYIKIQESHWHPHIELILRCGIAQRHPQDCNLIRLVAFTC